MNFERFVRHGIPNGDFTPNWDSTQSLGLAFWMPTIMDRGASRIIDLVSRRDIDLGANNSWVSDPQRGFSLDFTGSSSHISVTTPPPPVLEQPLTVSGWFNVDSLSVDHCVISIGDKDTTNNYLALEAAGNQTADNIRTRARFQGSRDAISTTAYVTDVWQLATGVYAGTFLRHAYLDGGGKGTNTEHSIPQLLDRITLGATADSTPAHFFSGQMADVRIYNRALTDNEVYELYINPWELYQPVRIFVASPPPVAGQPMQLRGTTVPGLRQWQPRH